MDVQHYCSFSFILLLIDWQVLLESCGRLLSAAGVEVPDENLYKLRVTDLALDAAVHLGQWEDALRYGMKTLPAYRYIFLRLI